MISVFLALRYTLCRLVNVVAVIAVALALTVQIVVMSVLDGMIEDMGQRVRDLGEQVTITFQKGEPGWDEFAAAGQALQKIPEVKGITPMLTNYGMLENQKRGLSAYSIVYGIDLKREAQFSQLQNHLQHIRLDADNPQWHGEETSASGRPGMFIGALLADSLGVGLGDEVTLLFASNMFDSSKESKPVTRTFVVSSTFRSGSPEKDRYGIYIPLRDAQELYLASEYPDPENHIPVFSVWLDDPEQADQLENQIGQAVVDALGYHEGRKMYSYTWQKRWRQISEGMKHENNLQELILALMCLSGGFCVFAILATLASRRVRDVGLLRCIGAGRAKVMISFLLVGLFIGIAGTGLGIAGGYYLTSEFSPPTNLRPVVDVVFEWFTGYPMYPPRMFGVTSVKGLPVVIDPLKIRLYAFGAILISVLAAAYPAIWAGTRQPVEALRNE